MITRSITLPRLGLIAATRAGLGAGIGLLLADRLNPDQRRAVGWTLVAVGVLTTFPLAADVLLGDQPDVVGEPVPEPTPPRREMADAR
jgi:hypothetical protein